MIGRVVTAVIVGWIIFVVVGGLEPVGRHFLILGVLRLALLAALVGLALSTATDQSRLGATALGIAVVGAVANLAGGMGSVVTDGWNYDPFGTRRRGQPALVCIRDRPECVPVRLGQHPDRNRSTIGWQVGSHRCAGWRAVPRDDSDAGHVRTRSGRLDRTPDLDRTVASARVGLEPIDHSVNRQSQGRFGPCLGLLPQPQAGTHARGRWGVNDRPSAGGEFPTEISPGAVRVPIDERAR